ncbi:MAG: hypothetical protein JW804_04105 [Sedimentisphaerales bacterium]|nr:hypothetical protein [Sedimentisphaerales bacterium]
MIKSNISLAMEQYFDEDGLLAKSIGNFEPRTEQVEMACAVNEALLGKHHLAVEAGTGVGKSMAYLVPAIGNLAMLKAKILISTFTITLQQQLINKDIPALCAAMPQNFKAVLAKGRSNYLCLRRLQYTLSRSRGLFDEMSDEFEQLNNWAMQTRDGSLSDIPFIPSASAWDAVKSEHGNCPAARCRHFGDCFYRRARLALESADIIIANHALLFSDLVLRQENYSLLPDYNSIIIDEAHNIESVAQNHFGIDISNHRVNYLLNRLYNHRTKRGFLTYRKNVEKIVDAVESASKAAKKFFKNVQQFYEQNLDQTEGRCYKNFTENNLSGPIKVLRKHLTALAKETNDTDDKYEITRFSNLAAELVIDLEDFISQNKPEQVYWIEAGGAGRKTVRLKSAPLNVGTDVKRTLFDVYGSVVLTSATLSSDGGDDKSAAAGKSGFEFFAGRIGLENFKSLRLGSPFDYERQVTLYIEKDLPDPNSFDFPEAAAQKIKKYVAQTHGRAFVLFTSYQMLNKVAELTAKWFIQNDINLLIQADKLDRNTLLKKFRSSEKNVLFGTDSFWQGVDVPGQALSNVIIVKLPFAVPNHPLIAARLEQIRQKGGNPFYEYQLPSAVIKFKQGFGRLIRNKTDTGIIVVLDSRLVNKKYGRNFLAAIPKCQVEITG